MKRKFLSTILAITLLFSTSAFNVFANQIVSVYLDNQPLQFDVPPQIINGRTMVPMRVIFEKLGATVSWDSATNTAHAYNYDVMKGVSITIGAPHMVDVYYNIIPLDVPAIIQDGRTLVPLRAISEAFGCDVQWDDATHAAKIYSEEFVDFSNSTDTQEEIRVSTAEQLLNSIGDNRKIVLTSNYYNLSTVANINNKHVEKQLCWDDTYLNAYTIKGVVNMTIEGNAEIVVDDLSADVLSFEKCGNITLSGLTVGHSTYYEEYACEGAVTSFYICDGVYINNCNLFGCGAIGVSASTVKNLQVNNSNIYDCTFTGMHLSNTDATVKNTQFYDSYHWGGFIMLVNSVANFTDCNIHDIKTDPSSIFAFIDIDDYLNSNETKASFNNCNFTNNSFINLASATAKNITFNNCSFQNNSGNTNHNYAVFNNSTLSSPQGNQSQPGMPTEKEYTDFVCNYLNETGDPNELYFSYSMDNHTYQLHIGSNYTDAFKELYSLDSNSKNTVLNKAIYPLFEEADNICVSMMNKFEYKYSDNMILEVLDPINSKVIYISKNGQKEYSYFDQYLIENDSENTNNNVTITDEQKKQIFSIVKQYVSLQLKSPSTALWPDYTELKCWYDEEGKLVAFGKLEAMNSFGGYGIVNYMYKFNDDLSINFEYIY